MSKDYDYIITGGGAAGLTLVYRMLQSPVLKHKRILLVDKAVKEKDDRTWCFWEKAPGMFEHIVRHRWEKLWVHQGTFSKLMEITPYTYKVIRGLDFYREVDRVLLENPGVERINAAVEYVKNAGAGVEVGVDGKKYTASWCFNSIYWGELPDKTKVNYLDQHFRGWFIRTKEDVFDDRVATFMDFRTPQHGETRFFYVLPFSAREALVEVAIFSNVHLDENGYDHIIKEYIERHLPKAGNCEVEMVEQGNIPMTDFVFARHEGRVLHTGMAGGDTRASTGFTFWNIQQRVERMVAVLEQGGNPGVAESFAQKRGRYYDSLLLHVIGRGYYAGDALFARLFSKNPSQRILAFLNAETQWIEEIALMQTVPINKFLRALIAALFGALSRKRAGISKKD
jgi:lycopene beta-cyclase